MKHNVEYKEKIKNELKQLCKNAVEQGNLKYLKLIGHKHDISFLYSLILKESVRRSKKDIFLYYYYLLYNRKSFFLVDLKEEVFNLCYNGEMSSDMFMFICSYIDVNELYNSDSVYSFVSSYSSLIDFTCCLILRKSAYFNILSYLKIGTLDYNKVSYILKMKEV